MYSPTQKFKLNIFEYTLTISLTFLIWAYQFGGLKLASFDI